MKVRDEVNVVNSDGKRHRTTAIALLEVETGTAWIRGIDLKNNRLVDYVVVFSPWLYQPKGQKVSSRRQSERTDINNQPPRQIRLKAESMAGQRRRRRVSDR